MTKVEYQKQYKKDNSFVYISKYPIVCNNCIVMVEIDPILKTYKIIEFAKKLVILTEGTGKDVKALQRKAKKSLVQLGAKFYDIIGNKKRILYYNG